LSAFNQIVNGQVKPDRHSVAQHTEYGTEVSEEKTGDQNPRNSKYQTAGAREGENINFTSHTACLTTTNKLAARSVRLPCLFVLV